jgi:3-phenylpropionate/cinnamic acid dioxygenase small subunit
LAEQRSRAQSSRSESTEWSCEAGSEDVVRAVSQFIYREARLADENRYDEWEALWTDDGVYWVPFGSDESDPATQMSVIYDNRSRIATRIKQFKTGKRHSATPLPRVRRIVSNIEVAEADGDEIRAAANFVAYESRERGITLWAGRAEYRLRRTPELRMAAKHVYLINNDRPLDTLSFLI